MNTRLPGAAKSDQTHGLVAFDGAQLQERAAARLRVAAQRVEPEVRIGVIHNVRARHNIASHPPLVVAGCEHAMPRSHAELHDVLAHFASHGVNALVIDGGDGTVRDVLSAAPGHFPDAFPRIAIIPSGKTNALTQDLGIPDDWTTADAVRAITAGHTQQRHPLEIWRPKALRAELRGFIFGAGAFVRATELAQTTHRFGAFNGLAVGLSIFGAVAQTLFGGRDNSWRRGEPMRIAPAGGPRAGEVLDGPQYMLLGSTLSRMPLGIKPFGAERPGLKTLRIDASPRRLVAALPALLGGTDRGWLASAGYHREDAERIDVTLNSGFILDGEMFEGGEISLRQGAAITFVVP
jgi:hypothetical protein